MSTTTTRKYEAAERDRFDSLVERDALTEDEIIGTYEARAELAAEEAFERYLESPEPDYYAAELAAGR